jgi:hypothetical protein
MQCPDGTINPQLLVLRPSNSDQVPNPPGPISDAQRIGDRARDGYVCMQINNAGIPKLRANQAQCELHQSNRTQTSTTLPIQQPPSTSQLLSHTPDGHDECFELEWLPDVDVMIVPEWETNASWPESSAVDCLPVDYTFTQTVHEIGHSTHRRQSEPILAIPDGSPSFRKTTEPQRVPRSTGQNFSARRHSDRSHDKPLMRREAEVTIIHECGYAPTKPLRAFVAGGRRKGPLSSAQRRTTNLCRKLKLICVRCRKDGQKVSSTNEQQCICGDLILAV